MKIERTTLVFALLTVFVLVADVEAGWKFWKKKDKDATTTTVAPEIQNPEPTRSTPVSIPVSPTTAKPRTSAGSAILSAGDPGLAIGVGSTGQDIRNNARPQRPNPGTEVGLDGPVARPGRPGTGGNSGQGYREWAAEIAGAGEPGRQPSRQPSPGPGSITGGTPPGSPTQPQSPGSKPAGAPGNGPQTPNSRPASVPGNTPAQPQTPGSRPASVPGSPGGAAPSLVPSTPSPRPVPSSGQNQGPGGSNVPGAGGDYVSTLHVGTLKPGGATTPAPSRPGSPGSPHSPGSPGSPGTPGRTWADVAGGGSRPNSPTPSPRQPSYPGQPAPGQTPPRQPGYPGQPAPGQTPPRQPGYPGQPAPGQTQPRPQSPGQNRPSTGTLAAGGALAGGALAGGALAGAAAAGGSTTTSNGKVYSSNPTYSKGNTITDEDLEKLSEALNIKDSNNANRYITLNLQKQTTSASTTDEAPQPLLTVDPQAYQIPTVQRVLSIFDNYQLDTHTNEYISPAQRQEESLLVDTFLSTNVMSAAMRFLADKGHVRKDYYEYKDTLRKIWFNLFSRGQGKIGSTGFEHVFMTELKPGTTGPEVLGLHNWIYFSMEEAKRRADYLGYMKKVDLGNRGSIVKMHTKFDGHDKPVTTMFVGTSPELEMALYTVCFYARPDGNCPVSLGGTKFNIVTHKFKYRGNDLVGTAYPDI